MSSSEQSSKFNIQITGTMTDTQVVTGDYNIVTKHVGLSTQESDQLRALFAQLKSTVDQHAPAEVHVEASAHAAELEQTILAKQPDPGTVRRIIEWFKDHAPELAGAVVSVVVHPLVGKAVEGAGTAIADRFREVVQQAT